jgi:hypothetical protein
MEQPHGHSGRREWEFRVAAFGLMRMTARLVLTYETPKNLAVLSLLMLATAAAQTTGSHKGIADQTSTPQGESGTAEGAISDYLAKETAIDEEVEAAMQAALDACKDSLSIIAEKLEGADKIDQSSAVRKEIKRIESLKLDFLPNEELPTQARAAWRSLIAAEEKITKSVAAKRTTLRSEYYRKLMEFEKRQGTDIQHLRAVRASMMIRSAVESGKIATSDLVNPDSIIKDTPGEGAFLVGFVTGKGTWGNTNVLGRLQPIYSTHSGTKPGKSFGHAKETDKVLAKEGYAIGSIKIRTSGDQRVIATIQPIFMKIKLDGISLDPADSYEGNWLGGSSGTRIKEIGGRGKVIVGIQVKAGEVVDRLAVTYLK